MTTQGYQIHCNISDYDFDKLTDKLVVIGDVFYIDKQLYIWLGQELNLTTLKRKLRRCGIEEFWCEPLDPVTCVDHPSALSSWVLEKYSRDERVAFERAHQKELLAMADNIAKANTLVEILKQMNERRSSHAGGEDSENPAGETAQNDK